jgi:predicted  nucleic acid-binding Zn-ribbon protein
VKLFSKLKISDDNVYKLSTALETCQQEKVLLEKDLMNGQSETKKLKLQLSVVGSDENLISTLKTDIAVLREKNSQLEEALR